MLNKKRDREAIKQIFIDHKVDKSNYLKAGLRRLWHSRPFFSSTADHDFQIIIK